MKLALVATGGKIYHSLHAWNPSSHYVIGEHFSLAVICVSLVHGLGSAHNTGMQIKDIVHKQIEELALKRKLAC